MIITCSLVIMWFFVLFLPSIYAFKRTEFKYGVGISRFINRFLLDKMDSKNNKVYGFTLFCGRQGGGKTYSAVKYICELVRKYNCKVITNTPLDIECVQIKDISVIPYLIKNDTNYIIFLDEIQTLFDSRKMDNDFYTLFCQLRKRGIKIVGTSQIFERCALQLREQVNDLYYCKTFLGCLTMCTKIFPVINSSGKIESRPLVLGRTIFVQSDDIRKKYDTYYKI